MKYLVITALGAAALSLSACGNPCSGEAQCSLIQAGTSRAAIQEKLVTAKEGDTVVFAEGSFKLDGSLTLSTNKVKLKGAGKGKTVLDFGGQSGAEGLLVDANDFTMTDITVKDTTGDGVKTQGSKGVTFRNVEVFWSSDDKAAHGAYGLYPVQSSKVLIENCEVRGASDAGIYVGQSSEIIVRNNVARENVAGIEIENSINADVHGNTVEANTGGILVFALPGLTQILTDNVRVFNNKIIGNNTVNFGNPSSTVGQVPTGTGMLIMASTHVEVFGNTFDGNNHIAAGVVSYFFFDRTYTPPTPPNLQPFSGYVAFHGNTFTGNASKQDDRPALADQAFLIVAAGKPEILFDGVVNPAATPFSTENPGGFCASDNTGLKATVVLDTSIEPIPGILSNKAQFNCQLPALPEVTL